MESSGIPGEEVKLNTPVPTPHLNSCKGPASLDEAGKTAAVLSMSSVTTVRKFKNYILIYTEQ